MLATRASCPFHRGHWQNYEHRAAYLNAPDRARQSPLVPGWPVASPPGTQLRQSDPCIFNHLHFSFPSHANVLSNLLRLPALCKSVREYGRSACPSASDNMSRFRRIHDPQPGSGHAPAFLRTSRRTASLRLRL